MTALIAQTHPAIKPTPSASSSATAPSSATAYLDGLPPWLNYLVAAYPAAKLADNTFAVYEDAFGDEEPVIMRAAVRAAVRDIRFFPTVSELTRYVRKEREGEDQASYTIPGHLHYRRISALWPACPECGERVNPEWDDCPACADLARMSREVRP